MSSPSEAYGDPSSPPTNGAPTMTVAIIKTHALDVRFEIEKRIQEASFEIVKERQMEFDVETDPDTLYELFGEDAESFGEGPVWVFVLERRRAVEVWKTLMGDRDPAVAKQESPSSLRALYGTDVLHNAVMGSADNETAEIQIASLFVSSPVFPLAELPDGGYGSVRSMGSSVLEALRSDEGYAESNPSTAGGRANLLFKARALPSTHDKPDIVPRMSRAAALRAGLIVAEVDKVTPSVARAPLSKERLAKTFANVPGHKRAESIAVASTAAPTIAPRMTKAAALRLGITPAAPVRKTSNGADKATFEGVPGHKRRETITVASIGAPTVAPRLNKSAALRATKDAAPPSSYQFKVPGPPKLPGLSRSNSTSSFSSPSKPPSRPASAAGVSSTTTPKAAPRPRPSSVSVRPAAARPSIASMKSSNSTNTTSTDGNGAAAPAAARPKPRPSSVSAPTIAPRTNRSAALRAAKQEAENAAAAAAAARKNPLARPRPVAQATF
ncbi:Kinesin-like protein [Mycena kentingensis (nom. inval.)]|nr:Kinesin-like protein [Mycena kentingensis (nom. inval.)]